MQFIKIHLIFFNQNRGKILIKLTIKKNKKIEKHSVLFLDIEQQLNAVPRQIQH